jgi:hypothetical protein
MEFVTILEHGTQTDKVLGFVPGHANSLNLHGEKPNVELRGGRLFARPA